MSDNGGDAKPSSGGRRKDGRPFKEGNTREDGGYSVGKNRPPRSGQFKTGDGRKRGRRGKGMRNADTDFERELARRTTIRENGAERRVSKSHAVDLRLIDNAAGKGDNKAIEMVDARRRRIAAEKEETARRYHNRSDTEILHQYLKERAEELNIDPDLFGDPAPDSSEPADHG